ncbi:hypothetical protein B0H14DRAFT_3525506 [Mycena olivaceomarginata]|nr:hypothetical protein B0H14DRAFT_3525506 [Mycena olivaceomarginata]
MQTSDIAGWPATVIAPNSTVYRIDCLLGTIHHAKNIPILFIWMKAADIMLSNNPKYARYAFGFFIPSDTLFQVTDLAFMLLRLPRPAMAFTPKSTLAFITHPFGVYYAPIWRFIMHPLGVYYALIWRLLLRIHLGVYSASI